MKKTVFLFLFVFCSLLVSYAQGVGATPEYIKAITPEWKGERFPDGRPKIPDALLERAKKIAIEAMWGPLRNLRYTNQFEGDLRSIHVGQSMTGRAMTAQYMPARPDWENYLREKGLAEGRSPQGGTNSWPINVLVEGDVYVADGYAKIVDGTLIGDIDSKWTDAINADFREWLKKYPNLPMPLAEIEAFFKRPTHMVTNDFNSVVELTSTCPLQKGNNNIPLPPSKGELD